MMTPYSEGNISDTGKREFFLYSINSSSICQHDEIFKAREAGIYYSTASIYPICLKKKDTSQQSNQSIQERTITAPNLYKYYTPPKRKKTPKED